MEKKVEYVQFKDLSDLRATEDGEKIIIRLNTTTGDAADIEIPRREIGAIIQFLCIANSEAGKLNAANGGGLGPSVDIWPIEADGLGIVPVDYDLAKLFPETLSGGISERQAALVVRVGTLDLAFRSGNLPAKVMPTWLRHSADELDAILDRLDGKSG